MPFSTSSSTCPRVTFDALYSDMSLKIGGGSKGRREAEAAGNASLTRFLPSFSNSLSLFSPCFSSSRR